MITVKISTIDGVWPWTKQTPNERGVWDDCQFYVNQGIEECDYWVVLDGLHDTQKANCSPENTILITGEPYSKLHYPPKFLKQFGTVVTFHRDIKHPNIIYSHPSEQWAVGRNVNDPKDGLKTIKTYDELKLLKDFRKDRTISVITSNKAFYPGHLKRLEFVRKLAKQDRFHVDVFGLGIREINDKWDALAKYKYHIALENTRYPDYFTNKLTDPFLCGCYPFYYGCTNIQDYFPQGSLSPIDIGDFEKTVETIDKAIKSNRYEESVDKIRTARELVLDKYNAFPTIANIIKRRPLKNNKQEVTLVPARELQLFSVRAIAKVKREIFLLRTKRKAEQCIFELSRGIVRERAVK